MASPEVQAYVQTRMVPVETEVRSLADRVMKLEEDLATANNKAIAQDANLLNAEKRFEEVH